MKNIIRNKNFIISLAYIIFLIIIIATFVISIKLDKKRCEANGGKYIFEMSYGNKCHLLGDKENE